MSFLIHESADEYHAKAKHYLSSHQLADFRKCPQLYYRKKYQRHTQEESPAYLVGRAAHVLILEGLERFREDFAVGGPINIKTGLPFGPATKAWTQWAETVGKPVLSDSQFETIERMNESVAMHEAAVDLLQYGIAEAVVRAEYCGFPCQIRIDWLDPAPSIVDLKTCDDLTWFEADSRRYGYAHQLAFYGLIVDYFAEWVREMRKRNFSDAISKYFRLGRDLNQRDTIAVKHTVSGLLKLLYPNEQYDKEAVRRCLEYALETRRRVKEQLKKIGGMEFFDVHFSYIDLEKSEEKFITVPEQGGGGLIPDGPLNPGVLHTVATGTGSHLGLYRIETQVTPGNGALKMSGFGSNSQAKEAVKVGFDYFKANSGHVSASIKALDHEQLVCASQTKSVFTVITSVPFSPRGVVE